MEVNKTSENEEGPENSLNVSAISSSESQLTGNCAGDQDPTERQAESKQIIISERKRQWHEEKTNKKTRKKKKRRQKADRGGGIGILLDNNNCGEEEYKVETKIVSLGLREPPLPATDRFLRVIKPYPFTHCVFVKQRWIGKRIIDVFESEFGSYPKLYYENAIESGRILVNSKKVGLDHTLKSGEKILHVLHRHEPAVEILCSSRDNNNKKEISIIHQDDDILVVDKPSTMPVHPCGSYNLNSLFNILISQSSNKIQKLYTVHRLDRLTSGLVIIGKNPQTAQKFIQKVTNRVGCNKYYLAKVKGRFPMNLTSNNQSLERLHCNNDDVLFPVIYGEYVNGVKKEEEEGSNAHHALGYWIENHEHQVMGNEITLEHVSNTCSQNTESDIHKILEKYCDSDNKQEAQTQQSKKEDSNSQSTKPLFLHLACPCRISDPKTGICQAGLFTDSGKRPSKPAQTSFAPLLYNPTSDTTIVLCRPYTGRTHQIRLHLQYLGHPIANDVNYGGEMWYGNTIGEQMAHQAQIRMEEMDKASGQYYVDHDSDTNGKKDDGNTQANTYGKGRKPKGATTTDVPASEEEVSRAEELAKSNRNKDPGKVSLSQYVQDSCVWCQRSQGEDYEHERVICEFMTRSQGIWLHAIQYSFHIDENDDLINSLSESGKKLTRSLKGNEKQKVLCFRTPLPKWACKDS